MLKLFNVIIKMYSIYRKILSIKFNKLVGIRQLEGMEINFSFTSKKQL